MHIAATFALSKEIMEELMVQLLADALLDGLITALLLYILEEEIMRLLGLMRMQVMVIVFC